MKLQPAIFSLFIFSCFLQIEARDFLETSQTNFLNFFSWLSEESHLDTLRSLLNCYNQESSSQIFDFLYSLPELEKEQLSIPDLAVNYLQDHSPQNLDCMYQNEELQDILKAYNISQKILLKIFADVGKPLNFEENLASRNYIKLLLNEWQNGKFEEAPRISKQLFQRVLFKNSAASTKPDTSEISNNIGSDDPITDLKEIFEGFFSQAKVTGNTTVMNCYNNSTAKLTLNVLGAILVELSNNQFSDISNTLMQYKRYLPPSVEVCTNQDKELQEALKKYKIDGESLTTIFAAISNYAQNNYDAFNSVSCEINSDFQSGSYETVGELIGSELQTIFV